jgi:hypothetical protein
LHDTGPLNGGQDSADQGDDLGLVRETGGEDEEEESPGRSDAEGSYHCGAQVGGIVVMAWGMEDLRSDAMGFRAVFAVI